MMTTAVCATCPPAQAQRHQLVCAGSTNDTDADLALAMQLQEQESQAADARCVCHSNIVASAEAASALAPVPSGSTGSTALHPYCLHRAASMLTLLLLAAGDNRPHSQGQAHIGKHSQIADRTCNGVLLLCTDHP